MNPVGDPLLGSPAVAERLLERLERCGMITRHGAEEAPTVVHALADIEESCRAFLTEQLPKLVDPATPGPELEDVLVDISEEFRHIAYHIHDPQFFRVIEPTHDWLTVKDTRPSAQR